MEKKQLKYDNTITREHWFCLQCQELCVYEPYTRVLGCPCVPDIDPESGGEIEHEDNWGHWVKVEIKIKAKEGNKRYQGHD